MGLLNPILSGDIESHLFGIAEHCHLTVFKVVGFRFDLPNPRIFVRALWRKPQRLKALHRLYAFTPGETGTRRCSRPGYA